MPKFSQNFLVNPGICRSIVNALAALPAGFTVEIGPGKGALTKLLAGRGEPFAAVEIDPEMAALLRQVPEIARLCSLHNIDFLKADLSAALPRGETIRFVGNLPYDCGSAILQHALACPRFGGAVFMFQKEVAQRIVAGPGSGKYGLLALSAQCRARVRLLMTVGKNNFRPVPAVDSAVVEFVRLESSPFKSAEHEAGFFKTIRAAFAHRRKTVANSLSLSLCSDKAVLERQLTRAGINPALRPEAIPLEKYIQLADVLCFNQA